MIYSQKILKIFIPIVLIGTGLLMMNFVMDGKMAQLSEEDQILYRFINRQSKFLEAKYHMKQSGVGLGGIKLELMIVSFHRHSEPLTEQKARKLIVDCVNDFLDAINSDNQIRPFLKEYPFTAKNIDLTILNFGESDLPHYFPYIAVVWNAKGKIAFLTEQPSTKCGYYTEKYETYEEAVAILKQEADDSEPDLKKDKSCIWR